LELQAVCNQYLLQVVAAFSTKQISADKVANDTSFYSILELKVVVKWTGYPA